MQIPGYDVEQPIGESAVAGVYLAFQPALRRRVALKVLKSEASADAGFARRFLEQGRLIGQFNHPNVIRIFETGRCEQGDYLAMEYCPGGNLQRRLDAGLTREHALTIVRTLAAALGYAHDRGVLHLNLKPGNVLFRDEDTPVLADFGLAGDGAAAEELPYPSPEQVSDDPVDARSDLYSLGGLFYEMLTGGPPYRAEDGMARALMHVTHPVPVLPDDRAIFQPIVNTLLAKNPAERFPTAQAFVEALAKVENDLGRRRLFAVAAGSAALLVVLGLATAGIVRLLEPAEVTPSSLEPTAAAPPAEEPAAQPPGPDPRILELLEQGERRLQAGRLTMPIGDNAFESFSWVLELDPDNSQAQAGIERIVEKLLGQGEAQLKAGKITSPENDNALGSFNWVLGIDPGNPWAQSGIERIVAALLDQAEQQYRQSRLTTPKGDNAFETYQQVLDVDPNNAQAQVGFVQIVEKYLQLAEVRRDDGRSQASLNLIDRGLWVTRQRRSSQSEAPLEALRQRLETLRQELAGVPAQQPRRQPSSTARIEQLLAAARSDPDACARRAKLEQALESAAEGLQRDPRDRRLASLRYEGWTLHAEALRQCP